MLVVCRSAPRQTTSSTAKQSRATAHSGHFIQPPFWQGRPTWLANASVHVDSTASLARTISSDSHHNHQEEEDEIVVTTPRSRLGSGASVEEPAWLTDAAKRASSHVVLDLGSADVGASSPTTLEFGWESFTPTRRTTPNVERAMATSRRALDELRGLSTDELCDALLSLSHSCAQGVRWRWVAGVAETTRMARVLASAATANPSRPGLRPGCRPYSTACGKRVGEGTTGCCSCRWLSCSPCSR